MYTSETGIKQFQILRRFGNTDGLLEQLKFVPNELRDLGCMVSMKHLENRWNDISVFLDTTLLRLGTAIPGSRDTGIPDRFSIPKSRDYKSLNPGISGLENNV